MQSSPLRSSHEEKYCNTTFRNYIFTNSSIFWWFFETKFSTSGLFKQKYQSFYKISIGFCRFFAMRSKLRRRIGVSVFSVFTEAWPNVSSSFLEFGMVLLWHYLYVWRTVQWRILTKKFSMYKNSPLFWIQCE